MVVSALLIFAVMNLLPWVIWRTGGQHPHFKRQQKHTTAAAAHPALTAADSVAEADTVSSVPPVASNRGNAMLAGYDPHRAVRACDPLPSNVTVNLEDDFEVGMAAELIMPAAARAIWHGRGGSPRALSLQKASGVNGPTASNRLSNTTTQSERPTAYVLMVSNHKYVDGALVMGSSLRNVSKRVQQGACELVILVTDNINAASLRLLALVFDRVKVMRSLGRFAKSSAYMNTFDKAYLWFLTDYSLVMFLDADHLATRGDGVDGLWATKALTEANHILAVGGNDYFQTALMVVRPNRAVFLDVYLEFRYGSFNYNQWRARDGILIRNCFLKSVQGIGHPSGLHHFYGFTKPWFNHKKKPRKLTPEYMLTFDKSYRSFWRYYEDVHLQFIVPLLPPADGEPPYGGKGIWRDEESKRWIAEKSHGVVRPADFMWIQRYSKGAEYLRPVTRVRDAMMNKTLPSLHVVVAPLAASCEAACSTAHLVCREDALVFGSVNSCQGVDSAWRAAPRDRHEPDRFSGRGCEVTDSDRAAPQIRVRRGGGAGPICVITAGDDLLGRPWCNATAGSDTRRVCACVAPPDLTARPGWAS